MKQKSRKYTALAELSMAYKVEFYDSDIPKGMTADEYADQLAENGAYEECQNGGDFKVYQVHEETA